MMKFKYLEKIIPYIDDAFSTFYETMLNDERLGSFFENDEQIKELIEKQKAHFLTTLSMNKESIQNSYIKLGEYHYDIRIPYIDFMKGAEILQEHFLITSQHKEFASEIIKDILTFFKMMKSFTARGYLNRMLVEDKKDIEIFFKDTTTEKETYLPHNIVMEKIIWLKKLIYAIEHNEDFDIESNSKILEKWVKERDFISLEKKIFFEDIERRVMINTQNLFYFLKRDEYFEILPLYTSLLSIYKLTLMLNNAIALEYASKVIEGMRLDELTQFYRKDFFKDILYKEFVSLDRNPDTVFSVVYIDLDNFKNVNDNFGHYSGDKVIEKLGKVIRGNIRASDFAFRIGGDEFALILKGVNKKIADKICKKIKADFTNFDFIFNENKSFSVTLSIGILEQSQENKEQDVNGVIIKVDSKLYEAKSNGKNQIVL